jgi:hypothetical protein
MTIVEALPDFSSVPQCRSQHKPQETTGLHLPNKGRFGKRSSSTAFYILHRLCRLLSNTSTVMLGITEGLAWIMVP